MKRKYLQMLLSAPLLNHFHLHMQKVSRQRLEDSRTPNSQRIEKDEISNGNEGTRLILGIPDFTLRYGLWTHS